MVWHNKVDKLTKDKSYVLTNPVKLSFVMKCCPRLLFDGSKFDGSKFDGSKGSEKQEMEQILQVISFKSISVPLAL